MSRKEQDRVDWAKIKAEYVTTKTSVRKLAEKHHVCLTAVEKQCRKDGWVSARVAYNNLLYEKTVKKTAEKQSNKLANLILASDLMTQIISDTLRDNQQFNRYIVDGIAVNEEGNAVDEKVEKVFQKADTKAIHEMTAAIKDMVGVVRNLNNLPTDAELHARQLAIDRFEVEKSKAEAESNAENKIEIVLDEDLKELAK